MNRRSRPAQRHRHPADAGDARRDGRRAGRRRRLRRRPERQRAAGEDRRDARQGGGAVRAQRHAEQPGGDHEPLRPRRRIHRRPDGAHLPLGRRRRRGARQRPAAAARARSPTARWRWRASRRRSSPTMRTSRAAACSAWRTRSAARCCRSTYLQAATALAQRRGLATHLDGARLFNAAVAQAAAMRADAREIAAPFDSVSVCFSKGLGAPVGSALVRLARVHRARAPLAQDGGRRHAPGRHLAAAALVRARPSRRPPRRRSCAGARGWPTAWRASPGLTVEPPQTNILFADLKSERAAGAAWRT